MTDRDFSKDLTIMVAGTGKISKATLREELDDWVFGPMNGREVRLIIPIMNRPTPGMRFMVDWAIDVEADVQVVQTLGAGMTKELSVLDDIIRLDTEHETLAKSFELLLERQKAGDEVVFIMTYNKESVYTQGDHNLSDLEILCEAKNYTWLETLNAEFMADVFEGYESTDERILRESAEKRLAENELAEKAAKKAVAPRKAPAKKTVAPEPKLGAVVSEMDAECVHYFYRADDQKDTDPLVCYKCGKLDEPLTGLDKLVADAVARDKAQPKIVTEIGPEGVKTFDELLGVETPTDNQGFKLSATVDIAPKLIPVTTEEIWNDVAKARPSAVELRRDELIVELGENIASMGDAFSRTIRTYAALVEEVRNG
jgi:hypothetical protein